uniref:Uncharacterized protein n=1 Tax=Anguilla anguilla TaxID=7936 RepID=A0A0E9R4Q0_ANGAN
MMLHKSLKPARIQLLGWNACLHAKSAAAWPMGQNLHSAETKLDSTELCHVET